MKKEYVKIIVFAIQSVITVAVIVLACIFGIPCEHKETEWVVTEATCEDWGERQLVCQGKCGAVLESERLAPLGHNYGRYETTKKATCMETGSEQRACKREGCDSVDVVETKKTDHKAKTAVEENRVEPTCTQDGGYDKETYCSVCNAEISRESYVLKALGHTPASAVEENRVEATCVVDGKYDSVVYCSVCNGELARETVVLRAIGHVVTAALDGKTVTYTCSGCGTVSNGSEGLEYELNWDNTYTVTGLGSCTDKCVFIPAYIGNLKVVAIAPGAFANSSVEYVGIPATVETVGDSAFAGCAEMMSLDIPASVKTLGAYAFAGCNALIKVEIPGTEIIGEYVFYDCNAIESVVIGEGVKTVSACAFYGCDNLQSVIICDGVESIGAYAFRSCFNLSEVVLGNSIVSIGDAAFRYCTALESITLPDSLTYIGTAAFYGCDKLAGVKLPAGVNYIGDGAFYNCKSLTAIEIPASVESVNDGVFYGCENLASVVIPDSVKYIGIKAFYGCASLSNVLIPYSVTSIDASAFGECKMLTSVYYNGTVEEWCAISFADAAANPLSNGADLYINGELLTEFVVSHLITEIKDYAFYGCQSLVAVTVNTVPNLVETIGDYAFAGCAKLAEVTLGESLVSIGEGAFSDCAGLKSLLYRGTEDTWNAISKGSEWNANTVDLVVKYI